MFLELSVTTANVTVKETSQWRWEALQINNKITYIKKKIALIEIARQCLRFREIIYIILFLLLKSSAHSCIMKLVQEQSMVCSLVHYCFQNVWDLWAWWLFHRTKVFLQLCISNSLSLYHSYGYEKKKNSWILHFCINDNHIDFHK